MDPKMMIGLLVTLIAVAGVGMPAVTADNNIPAGAADAKLCVSIDENGDVNASVPACRRFVQNITDP